MSYKEERLLAAKTKLFSALGDNSQQYRNNLKLWFREKCTLEQFDAASRKLLTADKVYLHNDFFVAFLNKIGPAKNTTTASASTAAAASTAICPKPTSNTSSNNNKRKRSSRPTIFSPVDIYDYLPDDCAESIRPPTQTGSASPTHMSSLPTAAQRFAAQELFLPDSGLIMGRLLVAAWETGLATADDSVAEMVVIAVQMLLKNILTSVLTNKKHYRTTCGGTFFYDVGHPLKDPTLRNTIARQHYDDTPVDMDKIMSLNQRQPHIDDTIFLTACEEIYPVPKRRINLLDIYKALRDKNVIPVHSVHSINVERISQMLH